MDDFLEFLSKKRIVTAKQRPFYAIWVRNMYHFLRHMPGSPVSDDDVNRFIATITDTHQDWQVQQAKDAIRLYRYFLDQPRAAPFARSSVIDKLWVDAVDQMLVFMRLKHMSLRTEQTYITWMRQFYRYVKAVKPLDLKSKHVTDFLTYLTIERKVAKTTQRQAFNAILFFFRHVLKRDIKDLSNAIKSKKGQRLPVVLSVDEVQRLFKCMDGIPKLMAQVIYGGGLRSSECMRLRIKDLDFDRSCMTIRAAKGDKDRQTLLPDSLVTPLKKHLSNVRRIYDEDKSCNAHGVYLPNALERKFPSACYEWHWFWVFPSIKLSPDPQSGKIRRHHMHASVVRKAFRSGLKKAKIAKYAKLHSLRHYAELQIMPS